MRPVGALDPWLQCGSGCGDLPAAGGAGLGARGIGLDCRGGGAPKIEVDG